MNNINNRNMKVPEGWKRVRLGEIVIENSKSPFKVEEADNDGSYHFFTSGEEILKHSKYLIDDENIFISTGGTAYVNYYNGKSSYSADTYSLKSRINTLYLYYFLYRRLNHITFRYFIGSGLEHLQKQDFKNSFEVTFPIDFNEQQKIAEILETVDRAIEKTDKIIEKYKCIKQGLMQDLLSKGIDENGKIRSEKNHKFKNSPLGRIPEDWEVVRLIDSIGCNPYLIVAGPFGSNLKVDDYREMGIPILRLQNVETNKFLDKDIKFISEKKAKELSYHSFKKGDIILAKLGIPVGKTCIVPEEYHFGIVVADVVRIRVDPNFSNKEYISYILNYDICRKQLNNDIIGTTRPRVNLTQVRNLLIPIPPLPEQQRIAEILSQIDKTIEKEEAYKQKLDRIKKGLMEDLLTGRMRVNELIKEKEVGYE